MVGSQQLMAVIQDYECYYFTVK